MLTDLTLHFSR